MWGLYDQILQNIETRLTELHSICFFVPDQQHIQMVKDLYRFKENILKAKAALKDELPLEALCQR